MSTCIEKLSHTCGTTDALQVFKNEDESYSGYCFACNSYIIDPYGVEGPSIDSSRNTSTDFSSYTKFIETLPFLAIPHRKLEQSSIEYFKVRTAVSEEDGATPIAYFFPYYHRDGGVGYKIKLPDKSRIWSINTKGSFPFGWEQATNSGGKSIFITEGEEDAIALYQALRLKQKNTQYESLIPAVISLKNGAGGAKKEIGSLIKDIRHAGFRNIVLCFDKDEPGKKATEEVLRLIPNARTVNLPGKDANECVMEGRSLMLANSVLFRSSVPSNTRLVWGSSLYDKAREPAKFGYDWPWETMTSLTRGMRKGESIYFGSGVKMGKSVLANAIASHLIVNHDMKVFIAKPEETNNKTVKLLLGYVAGKFFHDPNKEFDLDAYNEAASVVGDNLCLLNLYQHIGWDTLRADIQEAASKGCEAVFIDPITNLTNNSSAGEANTLLQSFAQDFATIIKDLDLLGFLFCHLKAPDSGNPHEKGGEVLSTQFQGSRAMMRSCNYMMGLEGNKDRNIPLEERNIRELIILEDREFGATGSVKLYWDHHTGRFTDI